MAVAENAGTKIGSSDQNLETTVVSSDSNAQEDLEKSKLRSDSIAQSKEGSFQGSDNDQNSNSKYQQQERAAATVKTSNGNTQELNGCDRNQHGVLKSGGFNGTNQRSNGVGNLESGDDQQFKNDMRDLVDILSKLNPMAEEFVPPSIANLQFHHPHPLLNDNHFQNQNQSFLGNGFGYTNNFVVHANSGNGNGLANRRRRNGYSQGKRRMNNRTSMAQREEAIRKTVYVSDIDHQVTEEQLAGLFLSCGQVVDCRICGDPNSVLRFAFIEFYDEESARAALNLSGTMLGFYPVRVLPSKTAIAPVNPTFLPRSEDEREMCSRTIYCTNIDKKVTQADVKLFFESFCGEVQRLRLLGDYHHSTRIAFVEFTMVNTHDLI
ncbi:hypothetical protein SLEP1_g57643 [Rubroshorea leprosula]|uniref:RRM domain-containing protein n=1 Tax=Rubroshorea leprosula TaxID=152421 RepID=A0AAV5MQF2_9ROSI|nr:hypothetical protein SLEP1_g57643 [Rubroshorea leprosula]